MKSIFLSVIATYKYPQDQTVKKLDIDAFFLKKLNICILTCILMSISILSTENSPPESTRCISHYLRAD